MFVKIEQLVLLRIGSYAAGMCDNKWVLMVLKLDMSSTPSFSFGFCVHSTSSTMVLIYFPDLMPFIN